MAKERPSPEVIIGGRPYKQNARYDICAARALISHEIPAIWDEFIEYHTSFAFFTELEEIFEVGLELVFPADLGVRFRDKTPFVLDCQIGINTPVEVESKVRGWHVDNPVEIIGGMLYMRDPLDDSAGGDLEIIDTAGKINTFIGKAELPDDCEGTVISVVPYQPNTAVFFLNGINSIHGVTPRSVTPHYRNLVNFCLETDKPLFELPR